MQTELSEERQAQLSEYARRHGQDVSAALDEVLGDALAWELRERDEEVEAIGKGWNR